MASSISHDIEKLFLSYYSKDVEELNQLAVELRLRGVAPWIDKQGGFKIGDHSQTEARRAIREDCFGLLLYATPEALTRTFIRDVEIDEARQVRKLDPSFVLTATPRRIGFDTLGAVSATFGIDLAAFHGIAIRDQHETHDRRAVANGILEKILDRSRLRMNQSLWLQFSTREVMPDEPSDTLRIDAKEVVANAERWPESWNDVLVALCDVKNQLWNRLPVRHLHVHGSKHLTAAFMFGRVFTRYKLEIRQTVDDWWSSVGAIDRLEKPLVCEFHPADLVHGPLVVEIASRFKDVSIGVNALLAAERLEPIGRLQCCPVASPLDVTAELCRTMAHQVYAEIEHAMQDRSITSIHLFGAVPQALMMMLGQLFSGMPPVQLYEWTGSHYPPSCIVPGGVL